MKKNLNDRRERKMSYPLFRYHRISSALEVTGEVISSSVHANNGRISVIHFYNSG